MRRRDNTESRRRRHAFCRQNCTSRQNTPVGCVPRRNETPTKNNDLSCFVGNCWKTVVFNRPLISVVSGPQFFMQLSGWWRMTKICRFISHPRDVGRTEPNFSNRNRAIPSSYVCTFVWSIWSMVFYPRRELIIIKRKYTAEIIPIGRRSRRAQRPCVVVRC